MRGNIYLCLTILALLLASCNNKEIQSLNDKIDSLEVANKKLNELLNSTKKELDNYQYNPEKLLAEIEQNYKEKKYSSIKSNLDQMRKYHPQSSAFKKAESIYDKSIKDQEAERKKAEAAKAKAEAERKAKMAPLERIMEKYDCDEYTADLILHRRVCRGMTAAQARAAWGRPEDINRTVGSYGVHEQWCYDGNYLYFEDGILTTIQN